ncbi:MAG TPA: cupin-like domain-containing protein [Polyangiaceae bacterium]
MSAHSNRHDQGDIARVVNIEAHELFERYYATSVPVLLPSFAANWPALSKWSPQAFAARFGAVEVNVACLGEVPHAEARLPYQRWQTLPFRLLAELMTREANASVYLVAQSQALRHPELQELWDDLPLRPPFFDADRRSSAVSLWMGPAGSITPLHHDQQSVLLVQVYGSKRIKLISPEYSARLYNDHGGYSRVDPELSELDPWPLFANVPVHTVTLDPSDALFVPLGWWHHVRSVSASISISLGNFSWSKG